MINLVIQVRVTMTTFVTFWSDCGAKLVIKPLSSRRSDGLSIRKASS